VNLEFRRALSYVIPYWRRLALVAVLSVVSTALSLVLPYLSKTLIDRALIGRNVAALDTTVALFALSSIAGFALTAFTGLRYTRVSADILFDMRLAVYRHLQRLSPRFYARMPLGDILARVNNDVGEIQRVAAESLLAWAGNLLFLAGSIAAMLWLDLRLTLVGVALVPLSVWALTRIRSGLARRAKRVRETSAGVGSFLIETLQAIRVVVTSNAQSRETDRFRQKNAQFVDALMSMQLWSYLAGGIPTLIWSIGHTAVFIVGGRQVINGTLSLGTFIAFMAYQMRLMQPAHALMALWASLATVQVSLRRVHELLATAPDVADPAHPVRLPTPGGHVEFRGVSVDLGGRPILRDVSFSIASSNGDRVVAKFQFADLVAGHHELAQLMPELDGGAVFLQQLDRGLDQHRTQTVARDQRPAGLAAGQQGFPHNRAGKARRALGRVDVERRQQQRLHQPLVQRALAGDRIADQFAGACPYQRRQCKIIEQFRIGDAARLVEHP